MKKIRVFQLERPDPYLVYFTLYLAMEKIEKKMLLSLTRRQKTYLRTSAASEDSDQPEHSRSMIRLFTGRILDS